MIRYTVTYARVALDALARLWLNSRDRASISVAGDEIDRILRDDASQKGDQIDRGFRQLIVSPLVTEFSVNDDDRVVTVWKVRHIGELANGH